MAFTSAFTEEIDSPQNTGQLIQENDPPDGFIYTRSGEALPQSGRRAPVENPMVPRATLAQDATVARRATNKDDDDDLKNNHHQNGRQHLAVVKDIENHRGAAPPRERNPPAGSDFDLVRAVYEEVTGNRWSRSDTEAYEKHQLDGIPAGKIISALNVVVMRTPTKINSFKYFIREIVTVPDGRIGPGKRSSWRTSYRESGIIPWDAQIILA